MFKICLIEDEAKVADFIKKGLEENDFSVDIAVDGLEGQKMALKGGYDIVILDMMLPYIGGLEVCRLIRHENKSIPVLILSALGTIDDKVNGLNAGADDYLVKPFHLKELIARIEALSRRNHMAPKENQLLEFEDIKVNCWSKTVERAGKAITLTTKEYLLLELFMRNPNKMLSRENIAESVWGADFDINTNVIDVYINYLRNKIDKGFDKKLIHTIIGMGYILRP
jgi:DNA-binding response OmpR family regulator